MKFVYGTGNNAKIEYMRKVLKGLDIEIVGIKEITGDLTDIEENGNDPMENACAKATAYYAACRVPLFSCDSGLYIEGLPEAQQPGVNIRTIQGKRLTDEEMIAYYSGLVCSMGGQAVARYRNAICLIGEDGEVFSCFSDDIASERFILKSKPHARRNAGFPLDSLSAEIKTGKYYFDLNRHGHIDTDHLEESGFRDFFAGVIHKSHRVDGPKEAMNR